MSLYKRSKSSVMLLEILINLLFFSILCVCSLQFFIKSYQLTEKTTLLHHAVTACNNVATVFQSGDGTTDSIKQYYPDIIQENGEIYIYLNENYQTCDAREVMYYLVIKENVTQIPSINIAFYKNGDVATYSIDVYHYTPLSPAESEVAHD